VARGVLVPIPALLVVVRVDDVIVDTAFNVLTFKVENAAGAALLILDTVRVDTESVLDAMVLAERVLAERLDPLSVE
jgi:hypothetical protein